MAYITTPGFVGISLTEVSTDLKVPIGTEVDASDGNSYIYVMASLTISPLYTICILREDGTVVEANSTQISTIPTQIVVPQVSLPSIGFCGWAVTKGDNFKVLALANCAADVKLYATTGTGYVDDAGTALIQGLRLNTAITGAGEAVASSSEYMIINAQN